MADLISGTIENLLGTLTKVAYDEISSAWDVKTDLQKLKATLLTIQAVLLDAEEQQAHSRVLRDCLYKLKNVCYDIEDVLDLFEVETLTKQVIAEHGSFQTKVHCLFSSSNTLVVTFKLAHQIKNIQKNLDEIALEKSQFNLREIAGNQRPVILRGKETHSFVEPNEVIGRDQHKQNIVRNLLSLIDSSNPSVIPIVGIGGIGKTTLAKFVYNDPQVNTHFSLMMWICVSNDFNVKNLIVKIIKSISCQDCSNYDLDKLQHHMRSLLRGKRYLLILDDVWNEDSSKWDDLKSLLMGGASGSKIIVTTRSYLVTTIMGTMSPNNLELLPFENERRHQSSKNTRHLAISNIGILEKERNILAMLGCINNIRTFFCPKLGSETFFNTCLSKCKSLRVLNLESSSLEVLPYSIGTLKQLRFLNLSESKRIKKLPNSLCKLHSLQILDLSGCSELEELPKDIKYMISLRVLALTTNEKSLSETGIECLKSLRTLVLKDCKNLKYLFAGMECPPALETMGISNCPMLISLPRAFKCLTSLKFLDINNCQELDLGMEFENEDDHQDVNIMLSLKRLLIIHLPKLINLPSWLLRGSLKSLECILLVDCENLTELPESLPNFTSLKELLIQSCPSLKTLPGGMKRLTSLKKLNLSYCESLNLTVEEENEKDQLSESKLEKLAIFGLPKITTLPQWLLQWSMLSLETLFISDCQQLKTLPAVIQSLTSLKSLYIINCPLLIESCKTGEDFHRTAHVEKRIISDQVIINNIFVHSILKLWFRVTTKYFTLKNNIPYRKSD
ncbi:hypothetical protein ACFE04_015408 [Oxalis oulophora]